MVYRELAVVVPRQESSLGFNLMESRAAGILPRESSQSRLSRGDGGK
jgi:hypothetical protein